MDSSTNSQSESYSPNPEHSEPETRHNNCNSLKTFPRNLERGLLNLYNSYTKIEPSDFNEKSCELENTETIPSNLNSVTFPRKSSTSPPKADITDSYYDEKKKYRSRLRGRNSRKRTCQKPNKDKKPIQLLVAHKIKPKISNSSVQGVNLNDDALSESSQNIVNSLDEEGILDRYKETRQLLLNTDNDCTGCNITESSSTHKTRSLLREKFLKLLINLSGEESCKMQMTDGAELYCKVKAFHPNFDTVLIDEIQPNCPRIFNKTIVKSNDIISMEFYNVNFRSLLD